MACLRNGALSLEVIPELGAAIAALKYRLGEVEYDLMRPAPTPCENSSDSNFVLAPYSNRIRDGRFKYRGVEYQLNHAAKHAIHGDVRNREFSVVAKTDTMIICELDSRKFEDFNFPFALRYRVQYELSPHKLRCVLNITNIDKEIAPVGGGFHPYFPKSLTAGEEVELRFSAKSIYLYQGEPLPQGAAVGIPEKYSFNKFQPLRQGIDHCYGGWDAELGIRWPKTGISLTVTAKEPVEHLVLYTPESYDYFAVEPVSNCTDAFNLYANGELDTGMIELAPGQSCKLEMGVLVASLAT